MTIQADVITLLGDGADAGRVSACIRLAQAAVLGRLKHYAPNTVECPDSLNYVITEVAVARYNLIGSEGMSSEGIEGHSATYHSDLLEPYDSAIREAAVSGVSSGQYGTVRFL